METVKETLIVGGHRMLAAQESERIPDDAGADPDERRLTERGRPALTPATMNIAQAAAYIGIAKSTLYTWRTRRPGFGPRALRYRRSDLDAWIEAHAETLDLQAETDIDDGGRRSGGDQQATSRTLGSMSRRSRPRHG